MEKDKNEEWSEIVTTTSTTQEEGSSGFFQHIIIVRTFVYIFILKAL